MHFKCIISSETWSTKKLGICNKFAYNDLIVVAAGVEPVSEILMKDLITAVQKLDHIRLIDNPKPGFRCDPCVSGSRIAPGC
jgi:hypothetical protein